MNAETLCNILNEVNECRNLYNMANEVNECRNLCRVANEVNTPNEFRYIVQYDKWMQKLYAAW